MPLRTHSRPGGMWSLKVIHTDKATISDHGMIVACMALLRNSGMSKEQAIPIYQKLLDHHGLTAEAINADIVGAFAHLSAGTSSSVRIYGTPAIGDAGSYTVRLGALVNGTWHYQDYTLVIYPDLTHAFSSTLVLNGTANITYSY